MVAWRRCRRIRSRSRRYSPAAVLLLAEVGFAFLFGVLFFGVVLDDIMVWMENGSIVY